MVDNWIRLVSERIVKTNIAGAEIKANGLGYYPSSNQKVLISSDNGDYTGASFSDNTGDWVRIVEWQDGDGVYSSEEATIEVKVSSGWGEFTTQVTDYTQFSNVGKCISSNDCSRCDYAIKICGRSEQTFGSQFVNFKRRRC